jgi:hypothetical protein
MGRLTLERRHASMSPQVTTSSYNQAVTLCKAVGSACRVRAHISVTDTVRTGQSCSVPVLRTAEARQRLSLPGKVQFPQAVTLGCGIGQRG